MTRHHDVPLRHIDSKTTHSLERAIHSAHSHRKSLEITINSKGGDVEEGLRMIATLKKSPVVVNATVDGEAGSTAAVILQCARIRRMKGKSTLQYHYGNMRIGFIAFYDKEIAARYRKLAMGYQQGLIIPIMERTMMSEKDVHKLLREAKQLSAEEALARNLIDEIV